MGGVHDHGPGLDTFTHDRYDDYLVQMLDAFQTIKRFVFDVDEEVDDLREGFYRLYGQCYRRVTLSA